ncbi:hypothetical protein V6M85_13950 (plasmid) [Sulfolobus tengchongensis]|uniref:Uncharacterized protein n=1 Tax=Sulfolobus tengchongensis TaxID=207809 RepID=A0AAX4L4L2_9CREN
MEDERGKEPLDLEEKDLLFLISLLNVEDKEEFVEVFSEYLDELVSKTGKWKLLKGKIHISDEKMLMIAEVDDKARKWLINKVKEKARRVQQILEKIGEKE